MNPSPSNPNSNFYRSEVPHFTGMTISPKTILELWLPARGVWKQIYFLPDQCLDNASDAQRSWPLDHNREKMDQDREAQPEWWLFWASKTDRGSIRRQILFI